MFLWRRHRSLPAVSPRLKQKDPPGSKCGAGIATQPSLWSIPLPKPSESIILHQPPGPQLFTDASRRKIIVGVVQKNPAQKEIGTKC